MSALESRYRRALRWYPVRWREANEDAVIGTLLDVAEDDARATPAPGELANLRTTALVARLGPLGRIPTSVRARTSALTIGIGLGISVAGLAAGLVQQQPGVFMFEPDRIGAVFYGIWVAAFAVSLIGWRRGALILLALTIPVSIAIKAVGWFQWQTPSVTVTILLGLLVVFSFLGNPTTNRRGRLWLAAAGVGTLLYVGGALYLQTHLHLLGSTNADWFLSFFWSTCYLVALPGALIIAAVLWRARRSPWAPAILFASIPILEFALFGWYHLGAIAIALGLIATAAVAIAVVVLLLRIFGLRIRITRA